MGSMVAALFGRGRHHGFGGARSFGGDFCDFVGGLRYPGATIESRFSGLDGVA